MSAPGRPVTRQRGDVGLSLVELLVTMVIAGVILPLVFGAVVGAERSTSRAVAGGDAVADARLGLAMIDRQVRSGSAPLYLDTAGQSLGFHTRLAANGTMAAASQCMQYRVNGGALQTRSFAVTATPPAWTSVISGVTSTTTFTASGTSSVRVALDVVRGSGRPASVDSLLTTRNTTTESTTPCSALS